MENIELDILLRRKIEDDFENLNIYENRLVKSFIKLIHENYLTENIIDKNIFCDDKICFNRNVFRKMFHKSIGRLYKQTKAKSNKDVNIISDDFMDSISFFIKTNYDKVKKKIHDEHEKILDFYHCIFDISDHEKTKLFYHITSEIILKKSECGFLLETYFVNHGKTLNDPNDLQTKLGIYFSKYEVHHDATKILKLIFNITLYHRPDEEFFLSIIKCLPKHFDINCFCGEHTYNNYQRLTIFGNMLSLAIYNRYNCAIKYLIKEGIETNIILNCGGHAARRTLFDFLSMVNYYDEEIIPLLLDDEYIKNTYSRQEVDILIRYINNRNPELINKLPFLKNVKYDISDMLMNSASYGSDEYKIALKKYIDGKFIKLERAMNDFYMFTTCLEIYANDYQEILNLFLENTHMLYDKMRVPYENREIYCFELLYNNDKLFLILLDKLEFVDIKNIFNLSLKYREDVAIFIYDNLPGLRNCLYKELVKNIFVSDSSLKLFKFPTEKKSSKSIFI